MDNLTSGITGMTSQNWLTFIAQEKSIFSSVGLEHNYISFRSMREGAEKVAAGALPICSGAADTPVVAIDNGLPVKIIGALNRVAFGHLVANPEIKSLLDLNGKKVGTIDVDLGSTIVVKEVLKAGGLGESSFLLAYIGGSTERYDALINNQVDASYLSPPYDFMAQEKGYSLLADCAKMFPDYVISLYANTNFLSSNMKIVIKFLKALSIASRWIYDPKNKSEAIDILCRTTRIDKGYGEKSYGYIIEASKGIAENCKVDIGGLERLVDIMRKDGLINMPKPPADYVDNRPLKMALDELTEI